MMANNKSAVLFILFLLMAFLFLLFLIAAPLVLILGYSIGILQLPQLSYRNITIAATAGLFIIPVFFIYLAAIVVAIKKRRQIGKAPARYQWEGMFGTEEVHQGKRQEERRRAVSKPPAFKAAAAAVVIVIALVVLVLLLAKATNKTDAANVIPADTPSNVTGEKQNVFSRILAQVYRNATNETQAAQGERPAAAAKKAFGSVKSFGGKIKGEFINSASKVKSEVAKVPDAAWQKIAVAVVALLAVGTFFYSHRAGQLGEIPEWFRDWLSWLVGVLAVGAGRKRWLLLLFVVAVVCAAAAAVVFRKWLIAKFPSLMDLAVNVFLAVRDFVSVYRLYILIGVFTLLAIIGCLFIYETKGKKKEG